VTNHYYLLVMMLIGLAGLLIAIAKLWTGE
jgi:hypothetical protein